MKQKLHITQCNAIESATVTAEQQGPWLQQVRICSNATAIGAETEEKKLLTCRRPQVHRNLQRDAFLSIANP